jgi:iron complex transport system ATP-binding protein
MSLGPPLSVNHLTVRLGRQTIVDSAAFVIDRPQVVAVLGPNGSGKTTLLRAILGIIPAGGSIAWDGDASIVHHPARLARSVAYLAQSPTWVAGQTVSQTILAGRFARRGAFDFFDSPDDAAVVTNVAAELGLSELLRRPIEKLSGGQRQRVFLGRCLAQETRTLVLDEPATFLDLRHQLDLYGHVRRLSREHGKTIIMACHDLNLAATHADRMLVMNGGKIVADGTPDDVLTESLLADVYGIPASVARSFLPVPLK